MLDADRLGGRDLNAMDMVAIPYRLEQAVGEAQHHDVLDRLLPEEMVDAVDLAFVGQLQDPRVERPPRGAVSAARLLPADATEAAFPLRREAGRREPERKSVGPGTSGTVGVNLGSRRRLTKKRQLETNSNN